MIVCRPTPSSPATAATDQSRRPTCSDTQLRACSVIADRGGIASLVSLNVVCSHSTCRQAKIRFRQQMCTGTLETAIRVK